MIAVFSLKYLIPHLGSYFERIRVSRVDIRSEVGYTVNTKIGVIGQWSSIGYCRREEGENGMDQTK